MIRAMHKLNTTPEAEAARLVSACQEAKDPIPGLFYLAVKANCISTNTEGALGVMSSLMAVAPDHEGMWTKTRPIAAITDSIKAMGFDSITAWLEPELTIKLAQGAEIASGVRPTAWSVAGLLLRTASRDLFEVFMYKLAAMGRGGLLPGLDLSRPLTPIPAFLEPAGLDLPVGRWLPAFDAPDSQGKTIQHHDLLDLAIAQMLPANFRSALWHLQNADIEPDLKANYLGRQAAHAHDVASIDMPSLIHAARVANLFDPAADDQTRMNFPSSIMVGEALMAGASITQGQWSGPGQNQRVLGRQDFEVRELVHTLLFGAVGADTLCAATIKRLHEEGHDVVVAAAEHADSNQFSRHRVLPIHQAASMGRKESVVALINAGADTRALVHGRNGPETLLEMAAKSAKTADEVFSIVKSAESRRSAHSAIDAIEREMAVGLLP